jgi:predicted PurR-regulated permease PerM
VALLLVTATILGLVLFLGGSALTPFVIGLGLVYVLDPAVRALERRGLHPGIAVLIVYAVALLLIIEGGALLLRPLVDQLAAFVVEAPRLLGALDDLLRRITELYGRLNLPAPIREAVDRALAGLGQGAGSFDPTSLLPIARTIAGTVASIFGYLIVPVWAFYVLKDRERLMVSFDRSLPEQWRVDTWAVIRIVERVIGRWLRGQLFLGLVVGAATFVGLLVLGVVVDPRFTQFAVLLAVIAGLLELLPIIGPIISAVPTLLVALTISPQAVVAVVVLYTLVQQLENNILVPKIQGDAIELHPAIVIFALVLGGSIAGLLGAILSLPITAAARNVYRYLFRRLGGEAPELAARDVLPEPIVLRAPKRAADRRGEAAMPERSSAAVGRRSSQVR